MQHPAYPTALWQLEADKEATVIVGGDRRGGPTRIYYEIHGRGPIHVLVCASSTTFIFIPTSDCHSLTFHRSSAESRHVTQRGSGRHSTLATYDENSTRSFSLTTADPAGLTSPTP